jgi:hypothetical protein
MKKTGLILAAAAASLFVVGCATQADNSAQPQPAPVAAQPMATDVVPHYKGGNSCKKAVKKHHHHAAKKAAVADANSTAPASDASSAQ